MLLLSMGTAPQLYALYNSPDPYTSIPSFCKVRLYLSQISAMSCRWLLVMACIDRCISCSTNASLRRISSARIARRLVLIIDVAWWIIPIHIPIFSNIQPPGNIACVMIDDTVALYHRCYAFVMGGALPSMISFISCLVIWRSFQERRKRQVMLWTNERERRERVRDQHIIIMLLAQVAIFLVSAIPFMSFNFCSTLTRTIPNKSADRKAIEGFVATMTELLVYLITLSFYSNTLVSPTFRKQLSRSVQETFTWLHCPRHRRINPIALTAAAATTRNNTAARIVPLKTSLRELDMATTNK